LSLSFSSFDNIDLSSSSVNFSFMQIEAIEGGFLWRWDYGISIKRRILMFV